MAHRKWQETKLQQRTAGPGNMLGCCLVSLHFLWAILSTSTVECRCLVQKRCGTYINCGGKEQNWGATLVTHFLPQKYTPLSTTIERGIIVLGHDTHLQEMTIYTSDFEENSGLLLILITNQLNHQLFKSSRWHPVCLSALILESLYSSLATAINPRPSLLDFV